MSESGLMNPYDIEFADGMIPQQKVLPSGYNVLKNIKGDSAAEQERKKLGARISSGTGGLIPPSMVSEEFLKQLGAAKGGKGRQNVFETFATSNKLDEALKRGEISSKSYARIKEAYEFAKSVKNPMLRTSMLSVRLPTGTDKPQFGRTNKNMNENQLMRVWDKNKNFTNQMLESSNPLVYWGTTYLNNLKDIEGIDNNFQFDGRYYHLNRNPIPINKQQATLTKYTMDKLLAMADNGKSYYTIKYMKSMVQFLKALNSANKHLKSILKSQMKITSTNQDKVDAAAIREEASRVYKQKSKYAMREVMRIGEKELDEEQTKKLIARNDAKNQLIEFASEHANVINQTMNGKGFIKADGELYFDDKLKERFDKNIDLKKMRTTAKRRWLMEAYETENVPDALKKINDARKTIGRKYWSQTLQNNSKSMVEFNDNEPLPAYKWNRENYKVQLSVKETQRFNLNNAGLFVLITINQSWPSKELKNLVQTYYRSWMGAEVLEDLFAFLDNVLPRIMSLEPGKKEDAEKALSTVVYQAGLNNKRTKSGIRQALLDEYGDLMAQLLDQIDDILKV